MSFLKRSEVAKFLRVTAPTVRKIVKRGELKCVVIGGQKRIEVAELQRYLKRQTEAVVSA